MNKKQLKKIIAREGLILIGFILVILLLRCIPIVSLSIRNFIAHLAHYIKHSKKYLVLIYDPGLNKWINILTGLVISVYPLYWIIRFIIWAIKTLKQKEE